MTTAEFLERPIGSLTLSELAGLALVRDAVTDLIASLPSSQVRPIAPIEVPAVEPAARPARIAPPKKVKPPTEAKTENGPGKGYKLCPHCHQRSGASVPRCGNCFEPFK